MPCKCTREVRTIQVQESRSQHLLCRICVEIHSGSGQKACSVLFSKISASELLRKLCKNLQSGRFVQRIDNGHCRQLLYKRKNSLALLKTDLSKVLNPDLYTKLRYFSTTPGRNIICQGAELRDSTVCQHFDSTVLPSCK
jgi:hypothetical protein